MRKNLFETGGLVIVQETAVYSFVSHDKKSQKK